MDSSNLNSRICSKCNNTMIPSSSIKNDKSAIPWDKKQTLYKCESCNTEAIITNSVSIFTNIITGFFTLTLLSYFLFTGLFEFVIYLFSQSFFPILGGVVLTILIIVFLLGSLANIINGFEQIKINSNFPLLDKKLNYSQNSKQIKLALFLGIIPIIFSLLFGMVDYYFYDLNEMLVMFLLPIVFSPIIFAKRLKSSIVNVFYGTLFWFVLGILALIIFN